MSRLDVVGPLIFCLVIWQSAILLLNYTRDMSIQSRLPNLEARLHMPTLCKASLLWSLPGRL